MDIILLSKYGKKDFFMPRCNLTKDEMKVQVLKLKHKLHKESFSYTSDPKSLADQYLNMVLAKIEEYAR
jgi:acyl CoA:acetate/3-ketoacid CoA transferase alpha subunit